MLEHKNEGKPSKNKKYVIKVDDQKVVFNKSEVTGKEILTEVGKTPVECFSLYQKFKGCDFEKISLTEIVDLSKHGLEKFTVKDSEVYHYSLDDEPETTDQESLSANQILEFGGITPVKDYYLMEFKNDGGQTSHKETPDAPIRMECPGSKFVSIFRGATPVA